MVGESDLNRANRAIRTAGALPACLLLLLFLSSSFLLNRGLTYGHDLGYFIFRIKGIAEGLSAGSFPVRIQTSQINGYGYPVGIMFGDWFYYIPAMLHLCGLSLDNCYRLIVLLVNAFTICSSYYSFSRLLSSRDGGLAGSYIYTLSCYRLMDITMRADIGEALAMAYFPLLLLGYVLVMRGGINFNGEKERGIIRPWAIMGLSLAGVITSNVPLTVIAVLILLLATIVCLVFLVRMRFGEVVLNLVKAAFLSIALSLFYAVPFLDYYINGDLAFSCGYGNPGNQEVIARRARSFSQLFQVFPTMTGASNELGDDSTYIPTTIGAGLIVLVLCAVVARSLEAVEHMEDVSSEAAPRRLLFLMAIIALVMASNLFPWNCEIPVLRNVIAFISKIQFSWRFISIATLLLTSYALLALNECTSREIRLFVYILAISVSVIESCYSVSSFVAVNQKTSSVIIFDNNDGIYDAQFIPAVTHENRPDFSISSPGVIGISTQIRGYQKTGTTAHLTIDGSEGESIVLPSLYYPYYELDINSGSYDGCELGVDQNGRILIDILKTGKYELSISFCEPPHWRFAEMISALTAFASVVSLCKKCGFRAVRGNLL